MNDLSEEIARYRRTRMVCKWSLRLGSAVGIGIFHGLDLVFFLGLYWVSSRI